MTTKYCLYIGLNDKETKVQKIDTVEAYKIVEQTILGNGIKTATTFRAKGIYQHDDGTIVTENTLRVEIMFFDGNDEVNNAVMHKIVDTLKIVLNQESIAVTISEVNSNLW